MRKLVGHKAALLRDCSMASGSSCDLHILFAKGRPGCCLRGVSPPPPLLPPLHSLHVYQRPRLATVAGLFRYGHLPQVADAGFLSSWCFLTLVAHLIPSHKLQALGADLPDQACLWALLRSGLFWAPLQRGRVAFWCCFFSS